MWVGLDPGSHACIYLHHLGAHPGCDADHGAHMIPSRIGHQGWPPPARVGWPMTLPIAQMRLVRGVPGVLMRGSPVLTSKSSVNLTVVAPSGALGWWCPWERSQRWRWSLPVGAAQAAAADGGGLQGPSLLHSVDKRFRYRPLDLGSVHGEQSGHLKRSRRFLTPASHHIPPALSKDQDIGPPIEDLGTQRDAYQCRPPAAGYPNRQLDKDRAEGKREKPCWTKSAAVVRG